MSKLLSISINLSKIDKTKIIEGKNGAKYINVTLSLNDEKDKFDNDVSLWQGQSKEEREAKKDRNFLGNGRIIWEGESKKYPTPEDYVKQENNSNESDLPF